jgi:hypothetical protein
MSLLVLAGVFVDETVDTGSAKSSSCDALGFDTSPGTRFLAAAEGLDSTSNQGSLGGLLPLL